MERLTRLQGDITPCACGKQPRHLERFAHGGQHALECPPCGVRTAFHSMLQEAIFEWESRTQQQRVA